MRDILHREMDRSERPIAHESSRFPGHGNRLTSHARRIRTAPCECGSGKPYGKCCMAFDRQRSQLGIRYALPPEMVEGLEQRRAIEDAFRVSAFRTFYKAFREEHDPTIRFIRALLVSAKPIDDHRQILAWHRQFRRRKQAREARP